MRRKRPSTSSTARSTRSSPSSEAGRRLADRSEHQFRGPPLRDRQAALQPPCDSEWSMSSARRQATGSYRASCESASSSPHHITRGDGTTQLFPSPGRKYSGRRRPREEVRRDEDPLPVLLTRPFEKNRARTRVHGVDHPPARDRPADSLRIGRQDPLDNGSLVPQDLVAARGRAGQRGSSGLLRDLTGDRPCRPTLGRAPLAVRIDVAGPAPTRRRARLPARGAPTQSEPHRTVAPAASPRGSRDRPAPPKPPIGSRGPRAQVAPRSLVSTWTVVPEISGVVFTFAPCPTISHASSARTAAIARPAWLSA